MLSRLKQPLAGLGIVLLSVGFIGWSWYTRLVKGYFFIKAGILFPAMAVIGLGMILFPGYREERIARGEDISGLQGMKLITLRWWIILAAALATGGINIYCLYHFAR